MTRSRNDVVLLPIPFTDLTSRKVRPAIIIGRKGTDLFLVPVSSVLSNTDFPLKEWQAAGLNVPSGVKAQLATVDWFSRSLALSPMSIG
jgi:mRNA interferase MazF